MRKRKHVFYCNECGMPCMMYKKGKSHRVLVCPKCGVLATNGIGTILGGAVGSIIPGAGTALGATIGTAAEGLFKSRKKSTPTTTPSAAPGIMRYDNLDKWNDREKVQAALR